VTAAPRIGHRTARFGQNRKGVASPPRHAGNVSNLRCQKAPVGGSPLPIPSPQPSHGSVRHTLEAAARLFKIEGRHMSTCAHLSTTIDSPQSIRNRTPLPPIKPPISRRLRDGFLSYPTSARQRSTAPHDQRLTATGWSTRYSIGHATSRPTRGGSRWLDASTTSTENARSLSCDESGIFAIRWTQGAF